MYLLRSHIARGELERTKDDGLQEQLKADYELLEGILQDEKVLGFHASKIFEEIYEKIKRRVSGARDFQVRRDAEHLTQAICNGCGVFLTRDYKTIIGPRREWLEHKYPPIGIRLPSELLAEMEQTCSGPPGSG